MSGLDLDNDIQKFCKYCQPNGQWKPLSRFSRRSKSKDGRADKCKECESRDHKQYYKRKHVKLIHKRSKLKLNYGMTIEEFDQMFNEQKGACAICGTVGVPLVVDHDHKTGKKRKLLCNGCNHGLGRFKDNPVIVRRAAAYLEEHGAGNEAVITQ